jgi:hypothetical protein
MLLFVLASWLWLLWHRLNMELDLQSLFGAHVHSSTHWLRPRNPPASEPVFLNVYGAQESIPRNEFRQSM